MNVWKIITIVLLLLMVGLIALLNMKERTTKFLGLEVETNNFENLMEAVPDNSLGFLICDLNKEKCVTVARVGQDGDASDV